MNSASVLPLREVNFSGLGILNRGGKETRLRDFGRTQLSVLWSSGLGKDILTFVWFRSGRETGLKAMERVLRGLAVPPRHERKRRKKKTTTCRVTPETMVRLGLSIAPLFLLVPNKT